MAKKTAESAGATFRSTKGDHRDVVEDALSSRCNCLHFLVEESQTKRVVRPPLQNCRLTRMKRSSRCRLICLRG
jgi:hypothetical protein